VAPATCGAYTALGGGLPFAVDPPTFIPAGWEDDYFDIAEDSPSACPARSHTGALGSCHRWTYNSMPAGATNDAGLTAKGGAGVTWQAGVQGANNWGTFPGSIIPAGATKVSFWAKGAAGGESLTFGYGGLNVGGAVICGDAISNSMTQTLTNQWANYTIPVTGNYSAGMVTGFYWYSGQVLTDAGNPGGSITFFIDDIEWQM
jgi:hypothetical protein